MLGRGRTVLYLVLEMDLEVSQLGPALRCVAQVRRASTLAKIARGSLGFMHPLLAQLANLASVTYERFEAERDENAARLYLNMEVNVFNGPM